MSRLMKIAAVGLVAFGAGVFVPGVLRADIRLQGAGSTFAAPIAQRLAAEYQKLHPDVKVDYQSIGSGGGIKGITEKTIDFAGSDAPMGKAEQDKAGAPVVHIPLVAGAVVLAYNLPGVSGEVHLTGPLVADIFEGKLAKWNDPKIAAENVGVALPDVPIVPIYRNDGSGTTFVFTNYLSTQSESFKQNVGMGKQVKWPTGLGGKGNEGVTAGIQSSAGAIGYVELNYATANKIPFALLKNKAGHAVRASPDSVAAAGAGAVSQMETSLAVNIWNSDAADAYPIAAFTYVIVYKDLTAIKDQAKAKALADFLKWSLSEGGKYAAEMDYAPLAAPVQAKAIAAVEGLMFDGAALK